LLDSLLQEKLIMSYDCNQDNWDLEVEEGEDLEELEALLYSQIHYQQEENWDESVKKYSDTNVNLEDIPGEDKLADVDSGCGGSRSGTITPGPSEVKPSSFPSDLVLNTPVNVEESRYTSTPKFRKSELVKNPLFDEDENSDSDSSDDGIIILPKPARVSPEVIDLDSNLEAPSATKSDTIVLSDDCNDKQEDTLHVISGNETIKKKNNKRKIREVLQKNRKIKNTYYSEEYGSDFEDNFMSDSDIEIVENELDDSSLTLANLSRGRCLDPKERKMSDIFSDSLIAARKNDQHSVPASWTKEMDSFYNDVDETFLDLDIEDIFSDMPTANTNWTIERSDVYGGGRERQRYFQGKRCNNCNQFGHFVRGCPEPVKVIRCGMCGEGGHQSVRCPDRACLRCGQPGFGYLLSCSHCRRLDHVTCGECRYQGHLARDCPDLWRRFHLTTQTDRSGKLVPVPADNPKSSKSEKECWCCNCGQKGHSLDNCQQYLYTKYPIASPWVVNYKVPTSLFNQEEEEDMSLNKRSLLAGKKEKKHPKKSKTCPNSPAINSSPAMFHSEPTSPSLGQHHLPSNLLVKKAIEKVGNLKKKNKKAKIEHEITENLGKGMSKTEILRELVTKSYFRGSTTDQYKRAKVHVQSVMKSRRLNTIPFENGETNNLQIKLKRRNEFEVERGFGKKNKKETNSKDNTILVPSSVLAACKFLKKEMQNLTVNSSRLSKKLKKDVQQELFGLKNLHGFPVLKKVERKRLSDLVLQLRNAG